MSAIAAQLKTLLTSEPDPTKKYFAITLLCSADGKKIAYSCYSHWVGFTEDAPRKEIREASIVHADRVVELWREMGETAIVVNSLDDMSLFFAFGGNGVIEEGVARSVIGEWLATVVVASVGQYGFTAIDTLPPGALNKAPTPKHRMRVLKRDNFRCRICGRSASDHVDLELHVHHIRPWAAGGVTEDSNLITLCHTCHNGLDPHYEFSIYALLPSSTRDQRRVEYWQSLRTYQAEAAKHATDGDA